MIDFSKMTVDELRALSVAAMNEAEARPMSAPTPLATPHFAMLVKTILDGVGFQVREKHQGKDFEHYVYEAAMTAVYGPGYWTWRNAQKW